MNPTQTGGSPVLPWHGHLRPRFLDHLLVGQAAVFRLGLQYDAVGECGDGQGFDIIRRDERPAAMPVTADFTAEDAERRAGDLRPCI